MQKKKKIEEKLHVDGMSCHGCEKIIEKSLGQLPGVIKVKANFNDHSVDVKYDDSKSTRQDIILNIEKCGYVIKKESRPLYKLSVILLIISVFIVLNTTNIFSFVPEINSDMSLGMLFVIGLLTSIHCVAMCGGINISVSASYQFKNINKLKNKSIKPGLLYNLGRVISYTLIGGIVGFIGSVISFNPSAKNLISVLVGFFMITLGISMTGILKNSKFIKIRLPSKISEFLLKQRRKITSPFFIGIFNSLMPCGPLQSMQIYALGTGSFIYGAISMFVFALGTVPLMLLVSIISSVLTANMSVILKKISAILIIFLGLVMLNRGIDLKALITNENIVIEQNATYAVIKDGYQEVTTRFFRGDYKPIVVQKGIPVKWIITIKGGDLSGCNNKLYIEEYDLTSELNFGENIIEFTPNNTGKFRYTCWMNMIKSNIYVVDKLE